MRTAYISTKEKAEHSVDAAESNPEEYASNSIENTAQNGTHEVAHQATQVVRFGVRITKDNAVKAKDKLKEFKQKRNVENIRKQTQPYRTTPTNTTLNSTAKQSGKTIRQSVTSSGKKNIKTAEKATTKTAQKTVKSAEQTSKTIIKTTKQAEKAAEASARASQKGTKATEEAAKATANTAKKGTEVIIKTTKAVINALRSLTTITIGGVSLASIIILIILVCSVAVLLGGDSVKSEELSYTPVSQEVENYEPQIKKYAKQYGVEDYVQLIKAVMMQESGGKGKDPMQCAESGYNTKYPNKPNGITDPEYSIDVGVHTFSDCINEAGVESLIDMANIKLALQGYNFGNGYISWAKKKYGCYSLTNATEFSETMAKKNGWKGYGDKEYVPHVLRYYPFGGLSISSQDIVNVALKQVGNKGGKPYWSWYGSNSRVEWCACFVSWCANECGYIDSGTIPKFSLVSDGSNWFKNKHKWQNNMYEPSPGAIIFFDWDSNGSPDHVGIVERVTNKTVYTIEGNSGDECKQHQYTIVTRLIYGHRCFVY